jgi:hypothetical protein
MPELMNYSTIGNIALPAYQNFFSPLNYFGFNLMQNPYQAFEYALNNFTLNTCVKAHSDLYLGFASKKESTFGYEHVQNFGRFLNLSSSLRTSRTEAFYKNQSPHFINFRAALSFTSPNRKFTSRAEVLTNRLAHKENGGVDTAQIYANKVKANTEVIPTYLSQAFLKKNTNAVSLLSYYHLQSPDSISDTSSVLNGIGKMHLFHQASFEEEWYRFNDSSEVFIPMPDSTNDSKGMRDFTYHHSINNAFGFLLNKKSQKGLNFLKLDAEHQYHYINQSAHKSYFNHVKTSLEMRYQINRWQANAQAAYYFSGYNQGDYRMRLGIQREIKFFHKKFLAEAFVLQQQVHPSFQLSYASSLKFHWSNSAFQPMQMGQLAIQIANDVSNLHLSYHQISNYTFYDANFTPQQFNSQLNLVQASLKHRFEFGRFKLAPKLLYQKVLGDSDVLRLPELSANLQAYFEGYLFQHGTLVQAGIEVNYTKAFYGNAYMPLLNQFYLQDKILVANYPQFDLFFNFKIQSVRFFFKIANVADGIYPTKVYVNVPGNPMYGRVIRLGLIWRFWN